MKSPGAVASKFSSVVAKSRTELYFVIRCKPVPRKVTERTCYTLQPTCNFFEAPLQQKFRRELHHLTLILRQHTRQFLTCFKSADDIMVTEKQDVSQVESTSIDARDTRLDPA